jgi:hypothetical protein
MLIYLQIDDKTTSQPSPCHENTNAEDPSNYMPTGKRISRTQTCFPMVYNFSKPPCPQIMPPATLLPPDIQSSSRYFISWSFPHLGVIPCARGRFWVPFGVGGQHSWCRFLLFSPLPVRVHLDPLSLWLGVIDFQPGLQFAHMGVRILS